MSGAGARGEERGGSGCILCGKCLSVCPLLGATGREELAPRAKARLAEHLLDRPEELDGRDAARLAALCLGCGRCAEACAQGVEPASLVARLRAAHPGWREWLWKQWISRAETLWPAAFRAGKFLGRTPEGLFPGRFGALLKSLRGLDRPRIHAYVRVAAVPESAPEGIGEAREVLLFSGCTGRFARPDWDAAARRLLAGIGLPRIEADFACCGSTLGGAGLLNEQASARRRNVEIWRAAGRPVLVAYCASCVRGLAEYAADAALFADGDEAALWAVRVTPLARLLKSARFVVSENAPRAVGYHRPCHAPEPDEDLALLRAALGGRLRPLPDRCCGFGGALRLAEPALAEAVSARRAADLAGAEQLLTGCTACALELASIAPETTRAGHWLEVFS
jgi:glycolate oxidase iron-sulfur subunit